MMVLRSRQVVLDGQRRMSAAPKVGRSTRLSVVAFREDRDDYSVQKRGKQAQVRGKQAVSQAKTNLKRSGKQVARGIREGDFEEPVANNSTVYGINAVALASAATIAALNPGLAAEVGFQHSFLTSTYSAGPLLLGALYPILSLGLSASAVANYVQSGGARVDDLDSTLHKRLNAALSTFSVAQLGLLGLNLTPLSKSILGGHAGTDVLNPTGILVLGAGCLIQLYVAGVNYARNAPEGYSSVEDVKSWLKDASNTFNGLDGPVSTAYALLTASLLAAGIGYIFAPGLTLAGVIGGSGGNTNGPEALVLWQLIGAGVSMVVAPMAYSCKEAAAANSLSDIRFKLLNIVLLTGGVGHLLVLAPRFNGGGALLPVVLGTWALAALLGGVNLLQKPKYE